MPTNAADLLAMPTPMPSAGDARRDRSQRIIDAFLKYGTQTMIATGMTGGLVNLTTLSGDDAGQATKLTGAAITAGGLVECAVNIGKSGDLEYVVLGPVDTDPAGVVTVATALNATAGVINSDLPFGPSRADTATTASTPNTGTFVDAYSDATFTLPAGTFIIKVVGYLAMKRSPAGQAHMRLVIDGNNGPTRVVNCDASIWGTKVQSGYQAGVAGGRAITIKIQYKGDSGTGVTTSAIEPLLDVSYYRTA